VDVDEARAQLLRLIYAGLECHACGQMKLIVRPHRPDQLWCYGCGVARAGSPATFEDAYRARAAFEALREAWDTFWRKRKARPGAPEPEAEAAPESHVRRAGDGGGAKAA